MKLNIFCVGHSLYNNAFEAMPNLTTTHEFYPIFHSNSENNSNGRLISVHSN